MIGNFRSEVWESGVRNLFKYSKYYSGAEPSFEEGDIFRIIVPLDEEYSFDFTRIGNETNEPKNEPKNEPNELKSNIDLILSKEERETTLQLPIHSNRNRVFLD